MRPVIPLLASLGPCPEELRLKRSPPRMNYFGHAAIATLAGGDPEFVLGAMLPDLCAMAGVRCTSFVHPSVQNGVRFHVQTDSLFHQTQAFLAHNRVTLQALLHLGVRRGPARAAAHIGVEMLIDAQLIQDDSLLCGYLAGLRSGASSKQKFFPLGILDRNLLRGLCAHLDRGGTFVHGTSRERFRERLGHTLRGRARLAPTREELEMISEYLAQQAQVADGIPLSLEELRPLYASAVCAAG